MGARRKQRMTSMTIATDTHRSSRVRRAGLIGVLAAVSCMLFGAFGTSAALADFGFNSFSFDIVGPDGTTPYTQAGGHPYEAINNIAFNVITDQSTTPPTVIGPDQNVKDVTVELPAGFVGDPNATPKCTVQDLSNNNCAASSQIGQLVLQFAFGSFTVPVYNLVPPAGVPAQFGGNVLLANAFIDSAVRTGGDYGLNSQLNNISALLPLVGSQLTLWGVPADPSHDALRTCTGSFQTGCASGAPPRALLTNPTSCPGTPLTTAARADSWQNPGTFVTTSTTEPAITGCDHLSFSPSLTVQPDNPSADSPSGLAIDMKVPQNEDPNGLATAHLKKAVVALPPGVSINPSIADGLAACTPAQIGLHNASEPTCPDASKIGSAEVDSPLSADPLMGSIFLGSPTDIYVVAEGDGVLLKLHGVQIPDFGTGQLTTTFDNNPQLPFTDLKLDFFGGPRAALATPQTCGTFQTTSQLTPWSAPDSGPPATPSASFDITSGPNGTPCVSHLADRPFSPGFSAGTINPVAGAFSPLVLKATRNDGEQNLSRINVTLPPGVSAKLAGVPECPDAAAAAGSCAAASQVGKVEIGAGAGSNPIYLPGKVYLTGPYKGAPLGLSIVTPVKVGPFNLGDVVVRAAIFVNPTSARLKVVSDPLPTIHIGIPLRLRSVFIDMDRPNFTVNPTNCDPLEVTGVIGGSDGASANVSDRFQVGNCGALGFHPKLAAKLLGGKGATKHSAHPGLKVTLKPKGKANVKKVSLTLPHSIILDQSNINVCTKAQLDANACPANSKYGTAKAISSLLDNPLSGPVYLVTGKHKLPDLTMILNGQVNLIERGVVKGTKSGRLKTTFKTVPDVPLKNFTLKLKKGSHGLLVNSTNLCSKSANGNVAKTRITAHDGDQVSAEPKVKTPC
jgi:hypothetical protein